MQNKVAATPEAVLKVLQLLFWGAQNQAKLISDILWPFILQTKVVTLLNDTSFNKVKVKFTLEKGHEGPEGE